MEWLIFAVLSALTAALVAIFGKIGLSQVDPALASTLRAGIMFLFLFVLALIGGKFTGMSGLDRKAVFYISLAGVAGALSWLFYFVALSSGNATQVSAIDRTSLVFVAIMSVILLGESLSIPAIVGIGMMVIGAVLIAFF
jgi:transporter family protein